MVGSKKKTPNETYYWDACIFVAWLMDEQRPPGQMEGVREAVRRLAKSEIKIVTSVLTIIEVSRSKLDTQANELFGRALQRRSIVRAEVDIRTAQKAREIRAYYAGNGEKTLSIPDAIHVATAIKYGVDEFHTFDAGKSDKKSLGLLGLNGNVADHPLKICIPTHTQTELDFGERQKTKKK